MGDARIDELRELLPRIMLSDWVRLGSRLVRLLRDRHHAGRHDAVLNRLLEQARASLELRERRWRNRPALSYPASLPITARKDEIVEAIRRHPVVVVAGETGSGKTTQLPKMCLEAGLGIEAKIGCTQPRRVAALSISRRLAEELNVTWGREVGCKIRFDDRSSPESYVKLMTDGILLAETQSDPLLSEYHAIVIDEAHERSLNIDFLLGHLRGLLRKRPELKVIITSATIDTAAFAAAFDGAPVIEVSGRVYPVQVEYAPLDPASEERGEETYIDAAARAVERVLAEPGGGDALVFMPGERDIRETSDLLRTRLREAAEVIPLYGRLSSGDQQRVFAPLARRKVVVATNIAETSLTIPGIRYVIDTGLARISRYNPRTRIKRLPVEPISQSSANQRKGRAGRVREGRCIRLYSEADFAARPAYTQPEIQRANLAEVILRMKAFRLGEIETFPFINPPAPAAIQAGYNLLQELGALDAARELTPLGRDLARLPIDPAMGRMLLQAQREHAVHELLIIASGLSIQDPRERPLEQKDAAQAAHQRYVHPQSDFLTLLNLWNAVHEQWEQLPTQNQRRKFCKANFLSYLRMREWQDLHAQLERALAELGTLRLNESTADYAAIHRSILAGLLGHVARRRPPAKSNARNARAAEPRQRNGYVGVGNRPLLIFPGSALYDRGEKRPAPAHRTAARSATPPAAGTQPEWIVAGEIVETSQLFARTVAGIDPLWIAELAPHLCETVHQNPHWSPEAGRVLAEEITTFRGLEVRRRKVAYGNINPREATRIFLRSALVEENLFPETSHARRDDSHAARPSQQALRAAGDPPDERPLPPRYAFVEHNRRVRQKIEVWQTRTRRQDLPDLDDALLEFYSRRIENVSSLPELDRWLGAHPEPGLLRVTEADLTGGRELQFDAGAFPDTVDLGGQPVPVAYAYQPGEEKDGVTVRLNPALAQDLPAAAIEWSVPGLREPQVAELLRLLPKALRRELMPLAPKVAEIVRDLQPGGQSLAHDLSAFIRRRYGVEVPVSAWAVRAMPAHLRPRIEVVGLDRTSLVAGRDLAELRRQLARQPEPGAATDELPAWTRAAQQWEKFGLTGWTFGDLPERIAVAEGAGLRLEAWPGLEVEDGQVNLRLFRSQTDARRATLPGIRRLVELALEKDLAWLEKDLRALSRLGPLLHDFCAAERFERSALVHLKNFLLPAELFPSLTRAAFDAAVAAAKAKLPGLAVRFGDRVEEILKLRHELVRRFGSPAAAAAAPAAARSRTLSDLKQLGAPPPAPRATGPVCPELAALLPPDFLERIPFPRLEHLPRYLKALRLRGERAALNPLKDQERARQLAPYVTALRQWESAAELPSAARQLVEEFRWMVEEYKVSLFAQELGTAFPVSPKRLEEHLQRIREAAGR
ncbi:MAG TPA: ATP-dependent RNA helicase HrpA [Candidatus Paceibacterota bacterium]|nr:ATP-dependent RNA helicase HrpA [Candidatus Paceibacterota bacterium]